MKRLLVLLVLGVILLFGITVAVNAQGETLCPAFNGFEADFQIGVGTLSYVVTDLGLLSHGYFNLGAGLSVANIETQGFLGAYTRIGLYSLDLLKARCLVKSRSEWLTSVKAKLPLGLLFAYTGNWCPLSVGIQYEESYFKSGGNCKPAYTQAYSFFGGLEVPFNNGLSEVWMEWQNWRTHKILPSCSSPRVVNSEEPRLEIGFSACF